MEICMIVGLPIEPYGDYDNLNDKEKYELAVSHPDGVIFEDVTEFFYYLNKGMINNSEKVWFPLKK